jgi:hypothetical protein
MGHTGAALALLFGTNSGDIVTIRGKRGFCNQQKQHSNQKCFSYRVTHVNDLLAFVSHGPPQNLGNPRERLRSRLPRSLRW